MNTSNKLQFESKLSFEIKTIEWLMLNKGALSCPRQCKYYQIIWVTRGSGSFNIDMIAYSLAEKDLFFVPPGAMHQLRASEDISGYVVSFDAEFLLLSTVIAGRAPYDQVMAGSSKVKVLHREEEGAESTLMDIMKSMVREYAGHMTLQREILSALLYMLVIYLYRICGSVEKEAPASRKLCLVNNFRSQVEKYFLSRRPVAAYANDLLVSPTYLSGVVRSLTGYSANHHIQQRMVLEAKRHALYSDCSMKEIAYKLGFEDPAHFSKFFKQAAGINFSEFKSHRQTGKGSLGSPNLAARSGLQLIGSQFRA
jgi:AraC family transcriptional regulator, transcriptional activator of pobA